MFKKKSTIIKNNLYILNYVKEASPWFITLTVGISLTAFVDTISNTWLSKIVFDGMAQNTPYMEILTAVLILLGIMMISAIAKTLFNHIKSPVETEKIKLHIRSTLYKKTRHLDLFCFEDPDFYDEYTRALAEADTRAINVLGTLSSLSSALDPISEYELHNKMLEISEGKTVILISHRLSTTKDADRIYYIENGRLEEEGDHSALMGMDGKYARMFKVQAASYQLIR